MIIKIDPVPAPRMVHSDRWAKRPAVLRYFAFKTALFYAYQRHLPVPCKLIFTIRMPDRWSAKKKASMNGQPHCLRPDLDNLVKACGDSLLKEDSHVWAFYAEKRWGYEGSIEIDELKTP